MAGGKWGDSRGRRGPSHHGGPLAALFAERRGSEARLTEVSFDAG